MAALLTPYGIPRDAERAVPFFTILSSVISFSNLISRSLSTLIHRDKMLQAVKALAPDLLPCVHSVYSVPSSLFTEGHVLLPSEKGTLLVRFCIVSLSIKCPLNQNLDLHYSYYH